MTVIVIGVLSSIALPSYLNQAGKARGTEAKAILGAINRSQQAYRLENGTMANSSSLINSPPFKRFYNYQVDAVSANTATTITTTRESDLKAYSSRIEQNNDTFSQVICESVEIAMQGTTATAPTTISCPNSYMPID